jgi:hypothetical protein
MAQTGKISLKFKSQTPKTEQDLFNALAERLVRGEITATQASEEFKAKNEEAVAKVMRLEKENEEFRKELVETCLKHEKFCREMKESLEKAHAKVALKTKLADTLKEEIDAMTSNGSVDVVGALNHHIKLVGELQLSNKRLKERVDTYEEDLSKSIKELATLRRVSETLYAKRQEENMELEARNDFIIDLLTEDQVEELMARDKEAEEEAFRDTRRTEFLGWQMNLMKDYKAGKFTHAEGMRMMKEKYPEFYPDSDDEEEEECCDQCGEGDCVRCEECDGCSKAIFGATMCVCE